MGSWLKDVLGYQNKINEEGIVVIDNIKELPLYGTAFVPLHFCIAICQSGSVSFHYDTTQHFEFKAKDVAVIYPRHMLQPYSVSPDCNVTLVLMSEGMFENQDNHLVKVKRFNFEVVPSFHLDDVQFDSISNAFKVLKAVCELNDVETRNDMKIMVLNMIVKMLDKYNQEHIVSYSKNEGSVCRRFYDALNLNCLKERNVEFYAKMFGFSPKHFSRIICEETGHPVGYWIRKCIVAEAKNTISSRLDLSMQEVSDYLGFRDQASFSRYFKRETGITPTEYRHKLLH